MTMLMPIMLPRQILLQIHDALIIPFFFNNSNDHYLITSRHLHPYNTVGPFLPSSQKQKQQHVEVCSRKGLCMVLFRTELIKSASADTKEIRP